MSTTETLEHDQYLTEPDDTGEHGHASDALYVKVFVVLFLITAAEVATYVVDIGDFLIPALMVMMSVKFALVVGFFMHLRFDNRRADLGVRRRAVPGGGGLHRHAHHLRVLAGVMPVAAAVDAWRWQPHPEVWLLVLGVVGPVALCHPGHRPEGRPRGPARPDPVPAGEPGRSGS